MINQQIANNIDTRGFVLKTKYNADKSIQKKIRDTSELVKKQIIMLKQLKQKVQYKGKAKQCYWFNY